MRLKPRKLGIGLICLIGLWSAVAHLGRHGNEEARHPRPGLGIKVYQDSVLAGNRALDHAGSQSSTPLKEPDLLVGSTWFASPL